MMQNPDRATRLGDRLQQTVNGVPVNYRLDINSGLTQVLEDGTNTYLYGLDRLAQSSAADEYFLGDALGSVRQLTDAGGEVMLARAYEPYGSISGLDGTASSIYGFTGEAQDATGLVYLRARYYAPGVGRFVSRDSLPSDQHEHTAHNLWNYVESDPVSYTDPNGHRRVLTLLHAMRTEGRAETEKQDYDTIRDASEKVFKPAQRGWDRVSALVELCNTVLAAFSPPQPASHNVWFFLAYDSGDTDGSIDNFAISTWNSSGTNIYIRRVHFGVTDLFAHGSRPPDSYMRARTGDNLAVVGPGEHTAVHVPDELRFTSTVGGPPYRWSEEVEVDLLVLAETGLGFGPLTIPSPPLKIPARWR